LGEGVVRASRQHFSPDLLKEWTPVNRTSLSAAIIGAALVTALEIRSEPAPVAQPSKPQTQTQKKGVPARTIAALLAREAFPPKHPARAKLRRFLESISKILTRKSGGTVAVYLDMNAFKLETEDITSDQILGEEVDLSLRPGSQTLAATLQQVLRQLPTRNATYLVRRGCIDITTFEQAAVQKRLEQRVLVDFEQCPMDEALNELVDQTGTTIVVDRRVGDKKHRLVTATLLNDVSLGGALRLLTDQAGLRVVVVEDVVYVTTPSNVQRLRQELSQPLVPLVPPLPLVPQLGLPGAP
jgi:hypothetical protein